MFSIHVVSEIGQRDFCFLQNFQTSPGVHPVPYAMETGVLSQE